MFVGDGRGGEGVGSCWLVEWVGVGSWMRLVRAMQDRRYTTLACRLAGDLADWVLWNDIAG